MRERVSGRAPGAADGGDRRRGELALQRRLLDRVAVRAREQTVSAGLIDVEITETHRVHEHAGSAIVRARKPR